MNTPQHSPAARTFSRRTAVRSAAWSVPAISLAAAAPAFATSGAGNNAWLPIIGAMASAEWRYSAWLPRALEVGRRRPTSLNGIRIVTTRTSGVIEPFTLKVNVTFPHYFVRDDMGLRDRDMVITNISPGWAAEAPRYTLNGTDRRFATVTFTYTEALQPGGGLTSGGTLPLYFDAQRDTTAQHAVHRSLDVLAYTYTAPGFRPGAGVINVA